MKLFQNISVANSISDDVQIYPSLLVHLHDGKFWRVAGTATTRKEGAELIANINLFNDLNTMVFSQVVIDNKYLHSILLIDMKFLNN
jgi:hypothetical protein